MKEVKEKEEGSEGKLFFAPLLLFPSLPSLLFSSLLSYHSLSLSCNNNHHLRFVFGFPISLFFSSLFLSFSLTKPLYHFFSFFITLLLHFCRFRFRTNWYYSLSFSLSPFPLRLFPFPCSPIARASPIGAL